MATISFSDSAPTDVKDSVRFVFAATNFELKPGDTAEVDDEAVIAGAQEHPWLKVEVKPEEAEKPAEPTPAPAQVASSPQRATRTEETK